MALELTSLEQRPELEDRVVALSSEAWPTFLLHADTLHWGSLFDEFAGYQILLCDPDGDLVALGHTVPFDWDGTANDLPPKLSGVLERALRARHQRHEPTTLSALAAIVAPGHQRRGLSAQILYSMRSLASERGLTSLVAPVRPTLKSSYPLTPFERYVGWEREDGTPFDPWLRVHRRLGAEFMKVAPEAITVTGTVAEWEEWTGTRFPDSGPYVVPGALQPVLIDRERDLGRLDDPNVWMRHPVP